MPRKRIRSEPSDRYLLPAGQLRWSCDPAKFGFKTTADIGECPIVIIGQPRALEALQLGLAVRAPGYNIFVAGEVGTGRSTIVKRRLAALPRASEAPRDLCLVHNFEDPDQPRLLAFPAGQGRRFGHAMTQMVAGLRKSLPGLFESDTFRKRRAVSAEAAKERQKARLKEYEKKIEAEGFALVQVQLGTFVRPELMPVVAGNTVDIDQMENLVEEGKFPREQYDRLKAKHSQLLVELDATMKDLRNLEREFRAGLVKLDRELARPLAEDAVGEVRSAFEAEDLAAYLDDVTKDVLEHLERFGDGEGVTQPTGLERDKAREELRERMLPYAVNVLVDHEKTTHLPVVWETSPNYRNLFGNIERARDASGEWRTDHTRVRGGSVLRANGGFLVLDALDVLVEPGVWAALKRTLRTGMLEIQSFDPLNLFAGLSLKPQPIPIDVKVILIGTPHIYRLLHSVDEDFKKIFKIKADFALDAPLKDEELRNFACFVHKHCGEDGLPPFHRSAVAAVVEYGVRLAERRERITTRFTEVAEVVREAGYWAQQERAKRVDPRHIDKAIEQRERRVNLVEERLLEGIAEGTILIELEGAVVGQVNGLAVIDVGDHAFGVPSRITAVTAMGRAGIIDIERESRMSGSLHTKGVLILAGFLRQRFAQDKPLTLSASVCFEQSYMEIEGDSASSTELYALLSSLSGVPIRQGIAVTGSVNQMGEVQPIGGVNEKVEGYFDVCRLRRFPGRPGVMIPARNIPNLMLRKDVVAAVRAGEFRIWAVSTVEEGVEVLTGVAAGRRGRNGAYPADSVLGRVDARLRELAMGVRGFGAADAGGARRR
jgi:lon-related putative ATP-dependent protease